MRGGGEQGGVDLRRLIVYRKGASSDTLQQVNVLL